VIAFNNPVQLGEPRIVPQPGTPVRFKGKVIGKVVESIHDEITVEIAEEYRSVIAKDFSSITFGESV
jgi:hypothetical protein